MPIIRKFYRKENYVPFWTYSMTQAAIVRGEIFRMSPKVLRGVTAPLTLPGCVTPTVCKQGKHWTQQVAWHLYFRVDQDYGLAGTQTRW